ncbi:MAG: DUF3426 domain-containing protein [Methylovulum sp.]|nr:DUF3426 domain-containing protein [Methylovulum sp.]
MFTRCPNCNHPQPLTVEQLRVSRAILYCPHCAIHFDALELLDEEPASETLAVPIRPEPPPANVESDTPIILPWEQSTAIANPHWRTGVLLGVLLLVGQLLYFNSTAISRNHTLRRLCQPLRCPLPVYQNAAELAIISNALEPLPDQGHLFRLLISNQAAFAQAYPLIDLTLQDYGGNAIAQRRFAPHDYLFNATTATIAPEASVELRLHLAPTTQTVGGYTFDLTY